MKDKMKQEGRNSRMEKEEKRPRTRSRIEAKNSSQKMPEMKGGARGPDPARREKLRSALIAKLMSKYHPGISHSKTEELVYKEVDALMKVICPPKISSASLLSRLDLC